MRKHNTRFLLQIGLIRPVVLALCLSCSSDPRPSGGERIPSGSPMDPFIRFQYAVYYLPTPSKDPMAVLRQTLAQNEGMPLLVDKLPEEPDRPLVRANLHLKVQTEYAPPRIDLLRFSGHGLTPEQAEQLQGSRQAFIMDFAHPKEKVWEGLRAATEVAEALARETGGLPWDEETREVFTPDEWHEMRLASWTGHTADVSGYITIHAYKTDEKSVRAITLGMKKFGLPDVVAEDLSLSMAGTMGELITLFGQAMAEGAVLERPGEFDLNLRAIENEKVRDAQIGSLKSNAEAVALLALTEGVREKGDPPNRLVEIGFDRYSGDDVYARQAEMKSSFFGWEDPLHFVKHEKELLALSQKARAQLPRLQEAFSKGLGPGELIEVKVPFETPAGGQEFMWVEVTAWEGGRIKGFLRNRPLNIPSLREGQTVEVRQEDVFDYVKHYPDGRKEGNETGAMIEKMQQQSERE